MYGSGVLRIKWTGWALHKRQAFKRISDEKDFDRLPGLRGAQAPSKWFLHAGPTRCAASCLTECGRCRAMSSPVHGSISRPDRHIRTASRLTAFGM
jgi:hypothetical protein